MKAKTTKRFISVRPKLESIFVAFIFILLVFLSTYLMYTKAKDSLTQEIKIGLASNVLAAATTLNGDVHSNFTKETDRNDSLYISQATPLENIRKASKDIRYIYTNILVDNKVYFVINPSPQNDNDNDGLPDLPPALMDEYNNPAIELTEALKSKTYKVTDIYKDEWGTFISAYAPFYDSNGNFVGTLGMDQELSNYYKRLEPIEIAFEKTVVIILFIGLIIGLLIWYLRKHSQILIKEKKIVLLKNENIKQNLDASYEENTLILNKIKNSIEAIKPENIKQFKNWISDAEKYQKSKTNTKNYTSYSFNLKDLFKEIKKEILEKEIILHLHLKTSIDIEVLALSKNLYKQLINVLVYFITDRSKNKQISIVVSLLEEGINNFTFQIKLIGESHSELEEDFYNLIQPQITSENILLSEQEFETATIINQLTDNNVDISCFSKETTCGFLVEFIFKKPIDTSAQPISEIRTTN